MFIEIQENGNGNGRIWQLRVLVTRSYYTKWLD